jgi:hypothetical protein
VKEESASLNSEDVFILVTPATVFLWKGTYTTTPHCSALTLLSFKLACLPTCMLLSSISSPLLPVQAPYLTPLPLSAGTGSLESEAVVGDNLAKILAADYNNASE